MDRRYRAALFDFGGTLYSYRNAGLGLRDVLTELLARLGIDAEPERIRDAYRAAAEAAYRAHMDRDFYLHRDLFMDTYRRFALEIGGEEPAPELLLWCHERQCERVVANFDLRDDCKDTLRALRDDGLHVAIVSNIDDDYLHPMIDRCGLAELLHAWTSSEEARSCKPHAGIFRLALDKAGCRPQDALFVGDALEADVAGAGPLGMTTVFLREEGVPEPPAGGPQPTHTVGRLGQVLSIAGVGGGRVDQPYPGGDS